MRFFIASALNGKPVFGGQYGWPSEESALASLDEDSSPCVILAVDEVNWNIIATTAVLAGGARCTQGRAEWLEIEREVNA